MSVANRLITFSLKHGVKIISDGDWDGILASAYLIRWFKERNLEVNEKSISFPHPASIPHLKVKNAILIELPPSRGYKVEDEIILIDHHTYKGIFIISPKGEEILTKIDKAPSVARLVKEVLGLKYPDLDKLLTYVDLIDEGKSFENDIAQKMHKAYLMRIEDNSFRNYVLRCLIEGKINELWNEIERSSQAYDVLSKMIIPSILNRKREIIKGEVVFTWYNASNLAERICFREAMLQLEKEYKLVIVAAIRSNEIDRLHMGSFDGKIKVDKFIEILLSLLRGKIIGGGREVTGGIQFRVPNKINDLNQLFKLISEAFTIYTKSSRE